jgi:hypothetical protein
VTYLRGAGYQGFHAGWHATLRTTTVGYGGAAVGLRHALYCWGATQALWIPPIQTRILPYPQKVKLYPVNSVLIFPVCLSLRTSVRSTNVRPLYKRPTDIRPTSYLILGRNAPSGLSRADDKCTTRLPACRMRQPFLASLSLHSHYI